MGAARARSNVREQEDVLKTLPKGPRAREDGEEAAAAGLGGAFRDYGGQRGGGACFTLKIPLPPFRDHIIAPTTLFGVYQIRQPSPRPLLSCRIRLCYRLW